MNIKLKTHQEFKSELLILHNKFLLFIAKICKFKLQPFYKITITFYTCEYNQLILEDIVTFNNNELRFKIINSKKESIFSQGLNMFIAETLIPVSEKEYFIFFSKNRAFNMALLQKNYE